MAQLIKLTLTALVLTLLHVQPIEGAPTDEGWLHRPGTVYVCEGDTARLSWDYDHSMGEFHSVNFHKVAPEWKFLVSKDRKDELLTATDGVSLIENSTYGIDLDDTNMSDNGTYSIEIFLKGTTNLLDDKAELVILNASVCPPKRPFRSPVMYFKKPNESERVLLTHNTSLDVEIPGELRLIVAVPRADPPVLCSIALGEHSYHTCKGLKDADTECEREFSLGDVQHQVINVTLSFIAFQPSTTLLHMYHSSVHVPGIPGGAEEKTTERPAETTTTTRMSTLTDAATTTTVPVSTAAPVVIVQKDTTLKPSPTTSEHAEVTTVALIIIPKQPVKVSPPAVTEGPVAASGISSVAILVFTLLPLAWIAVLIVLCQVFQRTRGKSNQNSDEEDSLVPHDDEDDDDEELLTNKLSYEDGAKPWSPLFLGKGDGDTSGQSEVKAMKGGVPICKFTKQHDIQPTNPHLGGATDDEATVLLVDVSSY